MHSYPSFAVLLLFCVTSIASEHNANEKNTQNEDKLNMHLRSSSSPQAQTNEQEEVIYHSFHEDISRRLNGPLHLEEQELYETESGQLRIKQEEVSNTTEARNLQKPFLSYVIGGSTVLDQNRYPYMASILNSRRLYGGGIRVWHVCGGSLVAPNVVLGAAHCAGAVADYIQLGKRHVSGGTTREEVEQIETYQIIEQVYHPQWDRRMFYRDMVLYKIDGKSTKTPVRLSMEDDDTMLRRSGKISRILGWGKTAQDGLPASYLQEAEVSYIPHDDCVSHKYLYGNIIKEDAMMCFAEEGKDACQGDSGGPLIQVDQSHMNDPEYDVQVGVISWGVDCAHSRYPGVYAKLDFDWLEYTICNSINGLSPESCTNGSLYSSAVGETKTDELLDSTKVEEDDEEERDLCLDTEDDSYFQESWDRYEWNCPKVRRWWWYACLYYSSKCPESCCGEGNCDSETGKCIFGLW